MADPLLTVAPPLDWIPVSVVWYLSVGAIVLGHIVAVVLAHRIALRDSPSRPVLAGLPLVLLMIGYTVLSLWIIAAPITMEPGVPPRRPAAGADERHQPGPRLRRRRAELHLTLRAGAGARLPRLPGRDGRRGDAAGAGGRTWRGPVFAQALLFVAGFSILFILLGISVGLLGHPLFGTDRPLVRQVAGLLVIALGLVTTGLFGPILDRLSVRAPLEVLPAARSARAVGLGMLVGIGWTPCIGAVLGAILTMGASSADVGVAALLLTAYSAGLAVPFLAAALALPRMKPVLDWLRRHHRAVQVVSGPVHHGHWRPDLHRRLHPHRGPLHLLHLAAGGPPMHPVLWLALAIGTEVVATTALKLSDGFRHWGWGAVVVIGYAISFYALSVTLRSIPLGIVYAVWSGVGTAVIVVIGWVVFREALDAIKLAGIGLIIIGVVMLNGSGAEA